MIKADVDLNNIRSLLIIRLRSLGDTVLMTPVISTLRRWRPDLKLSVLTERAFAPLLLQNPYIDHVIILESDSLASKIGTVRMLRKQRFDAVLNLHGGTTSILFALVTPATYKIGFQYYRYSWLYNVRVPDSRLIWNRPSIHTVEHQLAPLKWLGIPTVQHEELAVFVEPASRQRLGVKLKAANLSGKNFILVHPSATQPTKQWDVEKFARLIDHIISQYNLPVVVTVGKRETAMAMRMRAMAEKEFIIFDDLEVSELVALIDQADVFIGCDSGPTHIAAALKKKIVVIFGSSDQKAWRPWNTPHEMIRSDLPCIPCPGDRCYQFSEPRCIKEITVESVIGALEKLMSYERINLR